MCISVFCQAKHRCEREREKERERIKEEVLDDVLILYMHRDYISHMCIYTHILRARDL